MKRLLLVALLLLAGCASHFGGGSGGTTTSGRNTSGTTSGGDAGANLACTHFRNVASDAANGLLTPEEVRTKLQEVYSDARVSSSPGIADGARRMLAAVTTLIQGGGSDAEYKAAISAFSDACTAAGF